MGMSFDAPEDVSGGDGTRVSEPGRYHLCITAIRDGEGPNGKPVDGFTYEADVLAGTVEGCEGKTSKETLFAPNLTGSDASQEMARKKLAAFFLATDQMEPDQLGKSVDVDPEKAVGKQLVVELERQMEKDDKGKYTIPTKYLQICYANIYHVDDPEVKDVPKNADALKMRDDSCKHEASWFEFKSRKGQPVAAGSAMANEDFSDL